MRLETSFVAEEQIRKLDKWIAYATRVASHRGPTQAIWQRTVASLHKRKGTIMNAEMAKDFDRLNSVRRNEGKKPYKDWRKSKDALKEALNNTGVNIEEGETVVAEGAYRNEREAEAKTGYTSHGKTKSRAKIEAQRERYASKQAKTPSPKHSKAPMASKGAKDVHPTPRTKECVSSNSFSLGDAARALGVDPKRARAKYRRNPRDFEKYETATRIFPAKHRKAIEALLKLDGRSK